MRLAGNEDFYEQISGEESEGESKFDSFMRSYEILLSKGFSEQLAEKTAISMIEGEEPMVQPTMRFALIYGDTNKDNRFDGELAEPDGGSGD